MLSTRETESNFENDAAAWSYIKKTTMMNLSISIRDKKDGMRVTQWGLFQSKKNEGNNMQSITSLFHKLDEMFMKNYEDVVTSKWETDLLGYFLEVHMDEYLDLTFKGERNLKGTERTILRGLFGIDEEIKTYQELAEMLNISQSTLRSVKQRAIEKLKSNESLEKIANFTKEYRITTDSWAREWENNELFLEKKENSLDKQRKTILILSDSDAKSYISKSLYKESMKVLKATEDYTFSEGDWSNEDDISERDLDMIRRRSSLTRVVDYKQGVLTPEGEDDLEDMYVTYNYKANLSKRAFDVEDIDNFKIGNNIKGGL